MTKSASFIVVLVRAVIDTNVWISAVLNPFGPPAAVLSALRQRRFVLVSSEPLLAELREVFERPRFARNYGVTSVQVSGLLTLLYERAELAPITGTIHLCRDADDDVVIETALVGQAEALVTRDDDLKGVSELASILAERGVAVLTVRRLLDAL